MTNVLIGVALTLWTLSGVFGYLVSMSRFSRRVIDWGRIVWHINLEIRRSPDTRFSRSFGRFLEVMRFCFTVVLGPISIFGAFDSRVDDEEYYDPEPKRKTYRHNESSGLGYGD